MTEKVLKVQKIENGTVIDHIVGGKGFEVVRLLGLEDYPETLTLLSNVHSKNLGKKDVIKIENLELEREDVNKIALLSPHASVNLVKDFEVKDKHNVKLPGEVIGILKCTNPVCITRDEPVKSSFGVESVEPLKLRCGYCERLQSGLVFE